MMKSLLLLPLLITFGLTVLLFAQGASPQYERGTIMNVSPHPSPGETDGLAKYDVSVKVRNTIYVVLYEPPSGANFVKYTSGMDVLVLIAGDTLTFNSRLTRATTMPILRKEELPPKPTIDWSKARAQYFEMKVQNLTEVLNLNREQQANTKAIAEEEGVKVSQFCFTPSIPKKERLKHWEKIVRSYDGKLKPFLTPLQWKKLQELRKKQQDELRAMLALETNRSRNDEP